MSVCDREKEREREREREREEEEESATTVFLKFDHRTRTCSIDVGDFVKFQFNISV